MGKRDCYIHMYKLPVSKAISEAFGSSHLVFKETKINFPKEYFSDMPCFSHITSRAF